MEQTLKMRALEIARDVIALRRDFHQFPEASFQEFRTTDKVAAELDRLGISYRRFEPTGLLGTIVCGKPGKTVALRADMDALSVTEKTGLEFASQNPGLMHACGHDTHTAMLLGAARILSEEKENLCGEIKLLFQPAEEVAGGAKCVLKQGALDGVDAIFGMHIFSRLPAGSLGIAKGTLLASADAFTIKVKGVSCHGAQPNRGADATIAAAAIVMNLQTLVSREADPMTPAVVTVGKLSSGTRFNVVSGEAVMEGTVRLLNRELREQMPELIGRIARETAAAFRCTAEVQYDFLIAPLTCDDDITDIALAAAQKVTEQNLVLPFEKSMGGEDFAEYTAGTKSSFIALGGGGEAPQHSDYFVIEEQALAVGVAMYAQCAADFLNEEK